MLHTAPIPAQPFTEVLKSPVLDLPTPQISYPITRESILHELTSIDRLQITKRLRVKSVLFLRGKKNRFYVRGPDQSLVYSVEEENSWWVGYFFYGLRPLTLKVINNMDVEVMRIMRPYACTGRVLPCQLQRLEIFSPPDVPIGRIIQKWTPVKPEYMVVNRDGDTVFKIYGPLITISFFNDVKFTITRPDGTRVGGTSKRWQGLTHALFFAPVTDRFSVTFDMNMPVEEKALLLAATLLLDYMYYDA